MCFQNSISKAFQLSGSIIAISLLLYSCGGGGGGGSPTPVNPPLTPPINSTSALLAPIASGVAFLPTTTSSANQLRASIAPVASGVFFTDSTVAPLKKLSLTDLSVTPIANKIGKPENVAISGQNVFWVDGGRLNKTSLSGSATSLLSNGARDPIAGATADIVVDSSDVYWVNTVNTTSCSPACTWIIQAVPLSGASPTTLVTTNREIVALTSDANNIYWEERGIEPVTSGCNCGSSIKMISKTGGAVVTLVDGTLNGMLPQNSGSWFPTGGIAISGSNVYFAQSTSNAYQLIGIANTGATSSVFPTVPTTVAYAQNAILNIRADSTNLYWLDTAKASLDEIAITGASSVTTLANGLNSPVGLAINSSNAFWSESGALNGCCMQTGAGQIREVPLAGGSVTTLFSGLDAPSALTIDSQNVYWAEFWRVADATLGGGSPTTLASGISSDMARVAADQSNVYILDGDLIKKVPINGGTVEKLSSAHGGSIGDLSAINQDIITDGNNVYWTVGSVGPNPPVVYEVPVSGGSVITVSNGSSTVNPQDCYWRIALDAQYVYWSTGSPTYPIGCTVKRAPITGGGPTTTIVDAAYLADFTVDGTNIYYSDLSSPTPSLKKVPVNGGTTSTLATNVVPSVLANDNANVYWIDPSQTYPSGIGKLSKAGGNASYLVSKIVDTDPLTAREGVSVGASGIYWTETLGGTIYTPPVASTLSFPLFDGLKAFDISGESRAFTVSDGCSGTGSITSTPATTPSTFESVTGYSSSTTITWSLTNCTPASYTNTTIEYYDSNYIPLGYDDTTSGGDYAVFQTTPTIPTLVTVGSSATIGTRILYSNSSKSSVNGKEVLSYEVHPDTAYTAIIDLITKAYDASGNLTATTQDLYRITASGSITRLFEDYQQSNSSMLHLVLTFQ